MSAGSPVTSTDWAGYLAAEKLRRARRLQETSGNPTLQRAELELCARDYFYWAENYLWLEDPHAESPRDRRIPLILWPEQRRLIGFLLLGISGQRDRTVNKGRKLGVTWLCLSVILWKWLFEARFLAKVGHRKKDEAVGYTTDSLMGKLRFLLQHLPAWMQPASEGNTARLYNQDNASEVLAEATTRNFGRGGRRAVVLKDEAAHIEPRLQHLIALALESVATSQWDVSTPNGKGNRFYRDWKNREDQDKLELNWRADPRRSDEWFESLLIENGGSLSWDEREQEHNCSFRAVSGVRIFRIGEEHTYPEVMLPLERTHQGLRLVGSMDFGSGPSATVTPLALLSYGPGGQLQRVFVDSCLFWNRTKAEDIGGEIFRHLEVRYGRQAVIWGDPAGVAVESDQLSWEDRIRATGVRLVCLPASYNLAPERDRQIELAQEWLDSGFLLIHEDLAVYRSALEQWQYDIPVGVDVEAVNRAEIRPRKDGPSHFGETLCYLVAKIKESYMTTGKQRRETEAPPLPRTIAAELGDIEQVF